MHCFDLIGKGGWDHFKLCNFQRYIDIIRIFFSLSDYGCLQWNCTYIEFQDDMLMMHFETFRNYISRCYPTRVENFTNHHSFFHLVLDHIKLIWCGVLLWRTPHIFTLGPLWKETIFFFYSIYSNHFQPYTKLMWQSFYEKNVRSSNTVVSAIFSFVTIYKTVEARVSSWNGLICFAK